MSYPIVATCSILANHEEFLLDSVMLDRSTSIIEFCETRLSKDIEDLHRVPNFNSFFNSRNTSGGGVALYVSEEFTTHKVEELTVSTLALEALTVSAKYRGKLYVICNIYRHPHGGLRLFIDALSSILSKAFTKYSDASVIVLGDFNVNLFQINSSCLSLEYLTSMYSLGYTPYVLRVSRVTKTSATLIDSIWINNNSIVVNSAIVRTSAYDHFPVH